MEIAISAVIPTRGDVDLSPIVENLRRYPEVKEIIFEIGNTPLNRYRAAQKARCEVIYVQDDDCVTDLRPLIEAYRPGVIVNAMTEQHQKAYPGAQTLIGFGAIFDKALLSVLDGWEEDDLFRRESDRVFATLNPHHTVFPNITILPWAHNPNRYCFQPEHGPSHVAILERIAEYAKKKLGSVDVLFLARNRLEFTRESLAMLEANTAWPLVDTLYLYDDQSEDGTRQYLETKAAQMPVKTVFCSGIFNGPMPVLLDCVANGTGALVCKIDNDVLMPAGWLQAGLVVLFKYLALDLLGIGYRDDIPACCGEDVFDYKPAPFVGGVGIFRRRVLESIPNIPVPFQEWRGINQADMKVGWLTPNLPVVLMDWLPFNPWRGYSERYQAVGWQRHWGWYAEDNNRLWDWWLEQRKEAHIQHGPSS